MHVRVRDIDHKEGTIQLETCKVQMQKSDPCEGALIIKSNGRIFATLFLRPLEIDKDTLIRISW